MSSCSVRRGRQLESRARFRATHARAFQDDRRGRDVAEKDDLAVEDVEGAERFWDEEFKEVNGKVALMRRVETVSWHSAEQVDVYPRASRPRDA